MASPSRKEDEAGIDRPAEAGEPSRGGGDAVRGSTSTCRYLLEEGGVALRPGVALGRDDFVRLSYANSLEEIERAMDRLSASISRIRDAGTPIR